MVEMLKGPMKQKKKLRCTFCQAGGKRKVEPDYGGPAHLPAPGDLTVGRLLGKIIVVICSTCWLAGRCNNWTDENDRGLSAAMRRR